MVQLGINGHVGSHRRTGRNQQRQPGLPQRGGQKAEQRQRQAGNQQQPHCGIAVQSGSGEQRTEVRLGQVDAEDNHGDGGVHRRHRGDRRGQDGGQREPQVKTRQTGDEAEQNGVGNDFPRRQPPLLSSQHGHAVGPLEEVQQRDKGGGVNHRFAAQHCLNHGQTHKARVGEGRAEVVNGSPAENQAGDQHRQQQRRQTEPKRIEQAAAFLRRVLRAERMQNGAGQNHIEQQIRQVLTAIPADFAAAIQGPANSHQQKHHRRLPERNQSEFHMLTSLKTPDHT